MDERFDLIIDVQSKGIRATLGDIEAADKALSSLNADGLISKDTFQQVSGVFTAVATQLKAMSDTLKSGGGSWKHFTTSVIDARKETEALAAAQAKIKAGQAAVSGAQKSRSFEAELQGLSKLEQAERRLAEARKEYYNANRQVSRASASGDTDRQVAALKRQESAIREVSKAEREKTKQVAASASEEQKFLDAIAASHARNANARRKDAEQDRAKQMDAAQKATEQQIASTGKLADNLPRLRYALYDVSSSLIITGGAMTALSVASAGVAISMQRSFADVLRTTETFGEAANQADGLRKEFENLFTSMPVSWDALTEIGTLAGQLNIARGSVAEFTELVAMFAATTDVSIEQAATAFGRLSQLLDVPDDELQNLGSSILAVGVNSIATESEIIAISTQITSMASTAGFSADQVFGLSAALASLGTQPELSRGVVTRLFTKISVAIQEGGDNLERFGRLANMTGAEFAQAWGQDASGTLLKLMQGLDGVADSQAVSTLTELGITAARDVPTILRLAQNSDLLADSLGVAAEGYAEGTALSEQYSVISSTVGEKLNVLANTFQNLAATIGTAAGGLTPFIDILIGMVKGFTAFIDNPIAATIIGITTTLAGLAGALMLAGGLLLRLIASGVATKTVFMELARSGFTASGALASMTAHLTGVTVASETASKGTRAFGMAVRWAVPVLGALMTAAAIAGPLLENAFKSASDRATEFFGDLSGFHDAIVKDTQAWDGYSNTLGQFEVETTKAAKATDEAGDATRVWLGIQGSVSSTVDDSAGAIQRQTYILDENADAWLRNALSSNEAVQRLANDPTALAAFESWGGNISDLITAGLKGRSAVEEYMAGIMENANQGMQESLKEGSAAALEYKAVFDYTVPTIKTIAGALADAHDAAIENANTSELLTDRKAEEAQAWGALNGELIAAYESYRDMQGGVVGLENSIFGLGSTLAENGNDWSEFTEAGRANIDSLMGVMSALEAQAGDPATLAASLQGLFDFIVQGGYASAQQILFLKEAIASLGGVKGAVTAFNPASFFGGWTKGAEKASKATRGAGNSARQAAKEVRTLVDYGNDLEKVFSRAFDIRFSGESTLDKITSTFLGMQEALEESARSIQKLKAEIQGLQSDIQIQEYFLGIALEYGDSKRAEAIQANLAKLQADLADKTAALSKEEDKNSKSLTGNSKAAIENRDQMQGLVKQYQDHITALASSGMNQADLARRTAELKEQFIQQATQLGFNRAELDKYVASFDDMARVIARVPRNITVSANLNPAEQALAEYLAKVNNSKANVQVGGGGGGYGMGQSFAEEFSNGFKNFMGRTPIAIDGYLLQGQQVYRVPGTGLKLYDQGGYTGSGGKYEPAGIVHRGEYVVPKEHVNQRTGLPYADAMGRLTRGASGPGYAGGGYVQSNPAAMALQLASMGPMAMQQFHQVMSSAMKVYLDGRDISANSARNYAQQTAIGAN